MTLYGTYYTGGLSVWITGMNELLAKGWVCNIQPVAEVTRTLILIA